MADTTGTSPPRRSSIAGIKDKIKKFVSSAGGDKHPRTEQERALNPNPNKMENALETKKEHKQTDTMNEPDDVAGRKDKGLGGAENLVGGGGDGLTPEGAKVGQTGLSGSNY